MSHYFSWKITNAAKNAIPSQELEVLANHIFDAEKPH